MSLHKPKGSPFYQYDFWHRGHRFLGSTKTANKREAEQVERQAREDAKRHVKQQAAVSTSLALNDVCNRYWQEVGQFHAGSDNTFRLLGLLTRHFGKTKLLTDILDNDVAKLSAWRRGHRIMRKKNARPDEESPFISARTVNDTTEQLKKLFTRAKLWGARFDHEPKWKEHWLKEPKERVRELHKDEAERLDAKKRDHYAPFFAFVAASGMRWNVEARDLRWPEVYWDEGQIKRKGKNGVDVVIPITSAIREILEPLRGQHPEFVFTYVCKRGSKDRVKGMRYPLTKNGVKTEWKRWRKRAGVPSGADGFRCHDFRHDLATKLLRQTGNLKLVQHALGHADIKTTAKYAHVLKDEVAAALELVQKVPKKVPNSEPQASQPTVK